jgi:hypothetical protein
MKLEISLVAKGYLYSATSKLGNFLETATTYSLGRTSPDDLLKDIFNGRYQLWVVHDEDLKIYGFFATEITQYPKKKMMCIQHCVIEPNLMVNVEDRMQELAKKYAEDNQCVGIEFIGRPGWKRHATKYGYKTHSVCYQKFLNEV